MESPILNGWKEIAEFLNCHIRTAQKYAREYGLPVADIGGTIMASRNAIESWLLKNSVQSNGEG